MCIRDRFEYFAKTGRKATTCTNYKSYYNTYIRKTIGEKLITAIVKLDCQKIINQMVEDGKKHSTMTNLKSCLTAVFESAVDEDVILKNPARNLQIPQTEVKKRVAMDPEQIKLFMEYVRNSPQYSNTYPEFLFLFNTGAVSYTHLNQQIPSGSGECPVCHGTGWKIYREAVEGYKEPLEFARRCSKCKGKRRINDQTGVPPEYYSADLDVYKRQEIYRTEYCQNEYQTAGKES